MFKGHFAAQRRNTRATKTQFIRSEFFVNFRSQCVLKTLCAFFRHLCSNVFSSSLSLFLGLSSNFAASTSKSYFVNTTVIGTIIVVSQYRKTSATIKNTFIWIQLEDPLIALFNSRVREWYLDTEPAEEFGFSR